MKKLNVMLLVAMSVFVLSCSKNEPLVGGGSSSEPYTLTNLSFGSGSVSNYGMSLLNSVNVSARSAVGVVSSSGVLTGSTDVIVSNLADSVYLNVYASSSSVVTNFTLDITGIGSVNVMNSRNVNFLPGGLSLYILPFKVLPTYANRGGSVSIRGSVGAAFGIVSFNSGIAFR